MSRRGTSVAEALIAGFVAILILGALIVATYGAQRGEVAQDHDARFASELLVQELLESDLRRLLVEPGTVPVRVAEDGSELSFWVYEPGRGSKTALFARPVTYRMNRKKKCVERVEHGIDRITRPGAPYIQQVQFAVAEVATGPIVRVQLGDHRFAVRISVPRGLTDERLASSYDFRPLASFPDSSR